MIATFLNICTTRMDACPSLTQGSVQAIDLGCGGGALSVMAARAGAESVVAVDAHEVIPKGGRPGDCEAP